MTISAASVKELRERTGAGMMECKKALVEVNGELELAIEYLRKSGLAKADKKASRVAAEGTIVIAKDESSKQAAMLEVNCETDFVAKDDQFLGFVKQAADLVLAQPVNNVEEMLAAHLEDGSALEQVRQSLITKIGENIQVRRFIKISSDFILGSYVHGGKIGVVVELEGGSVDLAKDIAMHIAAINPTYITTDDVPANIIAKEKEILLSQVEDSNKPQEIIEKMIAGRLNKHLSEITLYGQVFVKDSSVTISKLLEKEQAKVLRFSRFVVGEGIEKKQENFAEEVMAQVGNLK